MRELVGATAQPFASPEFCLVPIYELRIRDRLTAGATTARVSPLGSVLYCTVQFGEGELAGIVLAR